jgi:hypothetical protein
VGLGAASSVASSLLPVPLPPALLEWLASVVLPLAPAWPGALSPAASLPDSRLALACPAASAGPSVRLLLLSAGVLLLARDGVVLLSAAVTSAATLTPSPSAALLPAAGDRRWRA